MSSALNICFVGTEYLPIPPPKGGGAEKFAYALAKTSVKLGHNVYVVSLPPKAPEIDLNMTSIKIWNPLESSRSIMQSPPIRLLEAQMRLMSFSYVAGKTLRSLYHKYCIDIVHTHTLASGLSVVLSKRPCRVAHVHTLHGYHTLYPVESQHLSSVLRPLKGFDTKTGDRLEHFVLDKADVITAVSKSLRQHVVDDAPQLRNKIYVVPNTVNVEDFVPNISSSYVIDKFNLSGKLIVLFVGRLTPIKGVKYLLLSVAMLIEEIPEIALVIAGPITFTDSDGARYKAQPYIQELQNIIDRHNMRKAVIFTGHITNEELRQLYCAARVVVVPSIWEEPCSGAILEAMASGKPVIATTVGGNPEMVTHGKSGLLVPPSDVGSLSKAMANILLDQERAYSLGLEGRKRVVSDFSWEAIAKRMISIYERVKT